MIHRAPIIATFYISLLDISYEVHVEPTERHAEVERLRSSGRGIKIREYLEVFVGVKNMVQFRITAKTTRQRQHTYPTLLDRYVGVAVPFLWLFFMQHVPDPYTFSSFSLPFFPPNGNFI